MMFDVLKAGSQPVAVGCAREVRVTIYGWDTSHYDGALTTATLTKAHAEGIEFFTHKLGEGTSNRDSTAKAALSAARAAGIKVIGGYWFLHGNDSATAEANACIAAADAAAPWWRDFPGWFWQADAESSSTGLPSPSFVKSFADHLASASGRRVIVYASHGQYGNRLAGLGHPLWNANYPSSRNASFKSLYPGDSYAGWSAYSGQTPALCQYADSATIAGKTTCDANAYRGSLDDLLTLIGADVPLTAADAKTLLTTDNAGIVNPPFRSDSPEHQPPGTNPQITLATAIEVCMFEANVAHTNTTAMIATLAALQQQITALQQQVAALQAQLG
jgi:GH25 family lysozyme M1 (1,4-beta-N-acetylmuramidase)